MTRTPSSAPSERALDGSTLDDAAEAILTIHDLGVSFQRGKSMVSVVEAFNLAIHRGERIALVGESGSGKSVTALAIMGLVGRVGGITSPETRVVYRGQELTKTGEDAWRRLRGREIALIFQDPLTALDPVQTVGALLREAIITSGGAPTRQEVVARSLELLEKVQLPRPSGLLRSYPHELSGGMRQRVMLASALAGKPSLLIADEPTTALDVTVQAEILRLVRQLCDDDGLAVLLITHDLSIVADFSERLVVMYGGRVVEEGCTTDVLRTPEHPYTAALLDALPGSTSQDDRLMAIPGSHPEPGARPPGCVFSDRCSYANQRECVTLAPDLVPVVLQSDGHRAACHRSVELDLSKPRVSARPLPVLTAPSSAEQSGSEQSVLLSVVELTKRFRVNDGAWWRRSDLMAIDSVSFDVRRGEAFGVVGESGSGKTTLARCLFSGSVDGGYALFDGEEITGARIRKETRRQMQLVFQDPASSLDPRMRVRSLLAEPLRVHGLWGQPGSDEHWIRELLDLVQLPEEALDRYPHQFSGGQRQRVAIARALTLRPALLVCDEPVSSLDVSVRSSVLNLLADLRRRFGLSLIFIAHDLALVRYLCDRVGVMWRSKLVEVGDTDKVFQEPSHPHTKALLAAEPALVRRRLGLS